jgi:hypothetical protein
MKVPEICELFISGIFHLLFSDHNWVQVTETSKSKCMYNGIYVHIDLQKG